MKKVSRHAATVALLLVALAFAFQMGRSVGFKTGSEWALIQADIIAREAGLFMPVYLQDNNFRVVIKQPRNLYKRAWERADRHDDAGSSLKTARVQEIEQKAANANL